MSDKRDGTASTAALFRAAHLLLDEEPLLIRDSVAMKIVPGLHGAGIEARRAEFQRPIARLARAQAVLRARYAEDALRGAAIRNVSLYVILGAGFDTFAYRQPAWAKTLTIIEVDRPEAQAAKRECLTDASVEPPANVRYLSVDLEAGALADALEEIMLGRPAFFSFLGVCQYLSGEAVEQVLLVIARQAPNSQVALTFNLPEDMLTGDDRAAARLGADAAAEAGEPWLSCFRPDELIEGLRSLGFRTVEHLTPREAQIRYFEGRRDGLHASSVQQCVLATV
ncbi:MAG: SAM-dependent methyltransferase [Pseudomonadota bacterium]